MAMGDYICCKDCGCKVIYDGYDTNRDRLEELWGNPDADNWTVNIIRCKPCFDKNEAEMTRLRQRVAELEADNDALQKSLFHQDALDAAVADPDDDFTRRVHDL